MMKTSCVVNLNIIGAKARMTRIMMNGPMKGSIQVKILGGPQAG